MANWKQMIVGDAFRSPLHDFNYYRDTFLIWPFLLFTIAGLVSNLAATWVGARHSLIFCRE